MPAFIAAMPSFPCFVNSSISFLTCASVVLTEPSSALAGPGGATFNASHGWGDVIVVHGEVQLSLSTVSALGLVANRSPEEARARGQYVLENDEHVDVLVARSVSTVDGSPVAFDDVWRRRKTLELADALTVELPSIDDLILTKRFSARPKDAEDIRLLRELVQRGES